MLAHGLSIRINKNVVTLFESEGRDSEHGHATKTTSLPATSLSSFLACDPTKTIISLIPDNDPLLGLSAVKAVKVPAALKG